jgi:hypothetical protein
MAREGIHDSFGARRTFTTPGGRTAVMYDTAALTRRGIGRVERLPYSIRLLLENLLRYEDGTSVTADDIEALAAWDPAAEREIAFRPSRVLLQDFTGVPAVVDLAAMRDAMDDLGGEPARINPLMPSELVIDHSVQVDSFGKLASLLINTEREFERNYERYAFLRWGQEAFENFRVVPPSTGIVHQVNLEYLARVVFGESTGAGGDGDDGATGSPHVEQWTRRARLGRGRNRGRGGDARAADQPAGARSRRLPAARCPAGGRDGHRSRAARDGDAAGPRRGREVRRVLRRGPPRPVARRPGDDRQHVARVRFHLRDLPDRRRDAELPAVHGA